MDNFISNTLILLQSISTGKAITLTTKNGITPEQANIVLLKFLASVQSSIKHTKETVSLISLEIEGKHYFCEILCLDGLITMSDIHKSASDAILSFTKNGIEIPEEIQLDMELNKPKEAKSAMRKDEKFDVLEYIKSKFKALQ